MILSSFPDSDSDPFERLRLERQQERIERTHKFLQKYFGSHFKIAMPNIVRDIKPVVKRKNTETRASETDSQKQFITQNSHNIGNILIDNTMEEKSTSLPSMNSYLNEILQNLPITSNRDSPTYLQQLPEVSLPVKTQEIVADGATTDSGIQDSAANASHHHNAQQIDAVTSPARSLISFSSSEDENSDVTLFSHSSDE